MSDALSRLDALLERLAPADRGDSAAGDAPRTPAGAGDAIDQVLAAPPRATATHTGLRDSAEMQAFRQALQDGLIAEDAAHIVLGLIDRVLQASGMFGGRA